MPITPSEVIENRFVILVTWRREFQITDDTQAYWRGFATLLEKDGGALPPAWFCRLEDVGSAMKQLLPPYSYAQISLPHSNFKPED